VPVGRRAPKVTVTREGRAKFTFFSTEEKDDFKIGTTHIESGNVGGANLQ
jgi:hypothetical protein